jgi:hypothetical protein
MTTDRPTQPPASADARADEFVARLKRLEKRTNSGMIRVLAEAWAHSKETST